MKYELNALRGTEWDMVDNLPVSADEFSYSIDDFDERCKWCDDYKGLGKYYTDTLFGLFYFERDEDREMYLLRWS
jgi:hypothetical protein